ncbi:hypothetical protein [Bacillus sp. 3255]|uniref:hypothetical protein n=1 Tax=Bacillus sp. 3255 TaxID=2817904 RepID=UPI00286B90B8|nr:hypothetical protein [Bacillus sp. 3255]
MVHFSIALRVWEEELTPEFLLGSLAPDAIHMREGTNRQDKGRTHLCLDDGTMPDLAVIHRFCEERLRSRDPFFRQFALGYAAHIWTDLRWTQTVWQSFVEQAGQQRIEPFGDLKSIYNREVCQLDYDLLRMEKRADAMLASVARSRAYSLPPLLKEQEIASYGDRVVRDLRDASMEPRITPAYITMDTIQEFMERTSEELRELMKEWAQMTRLT